MIVVGIMDEFRLRMAATKAQAAANNSPPPLKVPTAMAAVPRLENGAPPDFGDPGNRLYR